MRLTTIVSRIKKMLLQIQVMIAFLTRKIGKVLTKKTDEINNNRFKDKENAAPNTSNDSVSNKKDRKSVDKENRSPSKDTSSPARKRSTSSRKSNIEEPAKIKSI